MSWARLAFLGSVSLDSSQCSDLFGPLGEFFGSLVARYPSRTINFSTRGISDWRHFSRLSR